MARPIEPPSVEQTGDTTVLTHPAFGVLVVNKSMGGQTSLFGSDLLHDTTVTISLHAAEEKQSIGSTRILPEHDPLFKVEMSESQWARFVSAFGVAMGTPVTIRSVPGQRNVPDFPYQSETATRRADAKTVADRPIQRLKALREKIVAGTAGLSKTRAADMINDIDRAIGDLSSDMPWVLERFDEHMEERVEQARTEIHAYGNAFVRQLGLEALAERGYTPVELPGQDGAPRALPAPRPEDDA